jgi:hypothetical protein
MSDAVWMDIAIFVFGWGIGALTMIFYEGQRSGKRTK